VDREENTRDDRNPEDERQVRAGGLRLREASW
jgi:hypothetical protein